MTDQNKSNTKHLAFDPSELDRDEPLPKPRGRLDIPDDPQGDPDGAEARANPIQTSDFPNWVFSEFELSNRDARGQLWSDGKQHLRPTDQTIQRAMDIHQEGLRNLVGIQKRAMDNEGDRIGVLLAAYGMIINPEESQRAYEVMRSIGDIANRALAARAHRKFQYVSMLDRLTIDPGKDMPEYVDRAEARMADASMEAGIWTHVHRMLWKDVDYKGEPRYYVESQLLYELGQQARWVEDNNRKPSMSRANAEDYQKMVANY